MNKLLGLLVIEHLDLDQFFSVDIGSDRLRIMGYYNETLFDNLQSIGYEVFDKIYEDDDTMIELIKNGIEIILVRNGY